MKKLSLILCIALVFSLFIGCGSDGGENASGTASGGASDGIFSTDTVNYVDANGEAVYRIVRAENATDEATAAALTMFKQYRDAHGVSTKNMTDVEDGTDRYEILIGDTNRPESAQAKQWLIDNVGGRDLDFIICTIGKKIVLQGVSGEALTNAANYFVQNYFAAAQTGGIKYTYATEGNFTDITVNGVDIGKFSIVRPHYNSSYLTYAEVEKLVDTVYQKTGYELTINDDTVTDEAEYEIIIGDCERPNVTTPDNRDEYKVSVSGKKIYITGGAHQATTIAVSEFVKKLGTATALTDADSFEGSYTQTLSTYNTTTYYTPKFWDDFDDITGDHVNANGLDSTKWILSNSKSEGHNGATCERATDPEHVFVRDGLFQIHPYYDANTNTYYGGFLETGGKMMMTYGYIEYSARIPHGDGFWTAIWLRCHDYSGSSRPEIDIAECFGNSAYFAANMHTWPGNEAEAYGVTHTSLDGNKKYADKKYYCPDGKKFNDDFHTYGMLWTPEVAWFTCDGVPYFKYTMGDKPTDAWCFGKLMKICISEAVGFKNNTDPINVTEEVWNDTGKYYIDWVYVYQLDDGIQKMEFYGQ